MTRFHHSATGLTIFGWKPDAVSSRSGHQVTAKVALETARPPCKSRWDAGRAAGFRNKVNTQAAPGFRASCAPFLRKLRTLPACASSKGSRVCQQSPRTSQTAGLLSKTSGCTTADLSKPDISPSWPAKVPSRVEPPQVLGKTHVSGADCFRKLQVVPPVCYQKLWFVLLALMWLHAGYMSRKPCTAVCKQSVRPPRNEKAQH